MSAWHVFIVSRVHCTHSVCGSRVKNLERATYGVLRRSLESVHGHLRIMLPQIIEKDEGAREVQRAERQANQELPVVGFLKQAHSRSTRWK